MVVLLKDVAEYAKTSPGTVSRVLGGRASSVRISDSTRERVVRAARVLNYRPNHAARSLRMRKTHTIGVVIQSEGDDFRRIMLAEQYASQRGYELLLAVSRWDSERERDTVGRLLRRGVDGLLVLSPAIDAQDDVLNELVEKGFPFVGLGPTLAKGADYVDWNRTDSFRQFAEYLLHRGARKLGFLCWGASPGANQRIDGIRQAMQNVPGAELRILGCDEIGGRDVAEVLNYLRRKFSESLPDAVLCQTDTLALVAMNAASELGRTIPGEFAVTGGGALPFGGVLTVPLTTVAMPYEKLVDAALSRIIERIENPKKLFDRMEMHVSAEVIFRQSSLFGK